MPRVLWAGECDRGCCRPGLTIDSQGTTPPWENRPTTVQLARWARFVRSAKTVTQSERGPGRARNSRISGKYRDKVTLISSESKSTTSYFVELESANTDGTDG